MGPHSKKKKTELPADNCHCLDPIKSFCNKKQAYEKSLSIMLWDNKPPSIRCE